MEMYEIETALKYKYYSYQEDWERTRFNVWALAQINAKKGKVVKLKDIITFEWEEENNHNISQQESDGIKEQLLKLNLID